MQVTGQGHGRVVLAGSVCAQPGQRTRLIYRVVVRRGRAGEPSGFGVRALAGAARWRRPKAGRSDRARLDNDRHHVSTAMRQAVAARARLTVFRLPASEPELNPTEGVWAAPQPGLANLTPRATVALAAIIKTKLERMQYRPHLLDGFIVAASFALEPPQLQHSSAVMPYGCQADEGCTAGPTVRVRTL